MPQRATISSSYRLQLAAMGLFILGWCLWFLYDGHVGYPHKRAIAREFAKFKEEGRRDEWAQYARQRDWPDGTSGDPGHDYSDWDIRTQKIIGYGLLPFALLYCVSFLRCINKWIDLDGDAFVTSWGTRVSFDDVVTLNKTRWKSKGIAVALYRDGDRQRKLVLDNFKYARHEMSDMVRQLESHLTDDQIVGGVPESARQPEGDEPAVDSDPLP